MKYIKKRGAPPNYRLWRKQSKGTVNEDYPNGLQNPLKEELHEALVVEQGFLCAYTMKRIYRQTSHIEHIKPETVCRSESHGSDLDYENMVACFPRDGMARKYRYGAQERDNWWERNGAEFVTPLNPNCERWFQFDLDGRIDAVNRHAGAAKTIKKLGLDHPTLIEDRWRVINEFIFGKHGDEPLSVPKSKESYLSICRMDNQGEFHEFCVAIRDALIQHLSVMEKIAKKRKFASRK
jgi:uncharacterized protein (TIGR02646 family)